MSRRTILIAAGGTGGHLFPAWSLADSLRRLEVRVVLASDHRVGTIAESFPADEVIEIASGTPSGGSAVAKLAAGLKLGRGVLASLSALRRIEPAAVIGFGGYPTVPPVLAASLLRIPTVIHEQNGVIGRANRFLARRVSAIATGFQDVRGVPSGLARKLYHTGNPVRPAVLQAAGTPFSPLAGEGVLALLVFGGSQGARVMGDVVPAAIERLSPANRSRLRITQQVRQEDVERVRAAYRQAGVAASVEPFFRDLPALMAGAHLVVGRSGASTVAELAAIGRPSILVPLPGAIDQDQAANARSLETIGAATVIPQAEFTPERLAAELGQRFAEPDRLTRAAAAAKSAGILDAAERLTAVLLSVANLSVPTGKTS